MKSLKITICLMISLLWGAQPAFPEATQSAETSLTSAPQLLEEVLASIEARYGQKAFSTLFFQTSTIKALDITDSATGRIYIKHPGRMRWEYETPDKQTIVTDGDTLWIYQPDDNQVMIGKADAFFGDGKGAGFLSNISAVREHFQVTLSTRTAPFEYVLKLIPNEPTDEVKSVILAVSGETFDVLRVTTYNMYNDETRLVFKELKFHDSLDDALFHFSPPENAEILELGK